MALTSVTRPNLSPDTQLGRYRKRLEAAKNFREREGYDGLWERMIDLYSGKHFPHAITTEDQITVNLAFSTVNVIAPSIAVNHPKIVVWARKLEDDAKAAIAEAVVNYWWKHFKIGPEFKSVVKDFLIIGHGWMKVGYRYVEGSQELDEGSKADLLEQQSAQANQYAQENPELGHTLPSDDEIAANLPDTETVILEDRPFAERVSPFDVYVDPEATDLDDCRWICQKIQKSLEEVRNDDRYDKKVRSQVKADTMVNPTWLSDKQKDRPDDDVKRVTVYEFYDTCYQQMCVFTDSGDGFLVAPRAMPYDFGHPFLMLRNYDVPDRFYPMGDLEAIESLNLELDKTRSQMMNHRKKYQRKYIYDASAFDAQGVGDLLSDEDNVLVEARTSRPLNEVVVPINQTPTPPEFYNYSNVIEEDMNIVSGVSEYQRGAMPEIRRTATESAQMQAQQDARVADKLAQIELMVGEVGSRLVQIAQQFIEDDQTARVIDGYGQPMWINFTPDDIKGEFDFEVEGGSTVPKNDVQRKEDAKEMLQTFGPFMAWGLIQPLPLVSYALQYGWDVKNPAKFLTETAQDAHYHPMLREQLRESINYKDAPPDVQRQMEGIAGFQPSQQPQTQPDQAKLILAQQKANSQSPVVAAGLQAHLQSQDAQHQALLQQQAHQQAMTQQQGQQAHQVNTNNQESLNQLLVQQAIQQLQGQQQSGQQTLQGQGATSGNSPVAVPEGAHVFGTGGQTQGDLPVELLNAFLSMGSGSIF